MRERRNRKNIAVEGITAQRLCVIFLNKIMQRARLVCIKIIVVRRKKEAEKNYDRKKKELKEELKKKVD